MAFDLIFYFEKSSQPGFSIMITNYLRYIYNDDEADFQYLTALHLKRGVVMLEAPDISKILELKVDDKYFDMLSKFEGPKEKDGLTPSSNLDSKTDAKLFSLAKELFSLANTQIYSLN